MAAPDVGPQALLGPIGAGMATQGAFVPEFQAWRNKPTNFLDSIGPGLVSENFQRIADTLSGLEPTTFFQDRSVGETIPAYLNPKPHQIKGDKEVSHTYFFVGNDVKTGHFAFVLDRQTTKESDDPLAHRLGESVLSRTVFEQATIDRSNYTLILDQIKRLKDLDLFEERLNKAFDPFELPFNSHDMFNVAMPWAFSGREEDGRGGPSFQSKNHEPRSIEDGFRTREVPYVIARQYHWAPDLYVQNICFPRCLPGDRISVCCRLRKILLNQIMFQLGDDLENKNKEVRITAAADLGYTDQNTFIYLYQLCFYTGPSYPPAEFFMPDYTQPENFGGVIDPSTGLTTPPVPMCYAGYHFEIAQVIDPPFWDSPEHYHEVMDIDDPERYWREYNFRNETLSQDEQEGRLHITAKLARSPTFI